MKPYDLKQARLHRRWSQPKAAYHLGVSQPYLAMLETGRRRLTPALARRFVRGYRMTPALLFPSNNFNPEVGMNADALASQLCVLGYPGFAYLRSRVPRMNPGEVLLACLAQDELEPRLVEALPWLLLRYWEMDTDWLVADACRFTLQNHLGFVVSMARRVADSADVSNPARRDVLENLESVLYRNRLARENTFLKNLTTEAEKQWVAQNQSEDAKRWNLLTDWRPEYLPHVG
jgi:transcriptional regulator with XRE-family HTH domain